MCLEKQRTARKPEHFSRHKTVTLQTKMTIILTSSFVLPLCFDKRLVSENEVHVSHNSVKLSSLSFKLPSVQFTESKRAYNAVHMNMQPLKGNQKLRRERIHVPGNQRIHYSRIKVMPTLFVDLARALTWRD